MDEPIKSDSSLGVACQNDDKEIWRKKKGDFYSPSIHVTRTGCIGIDIGGHVIVMTVEKWHAFGKLRLALEQALRPDYF
jgi:hypothetical protein